MEQRGFKKLADLFGQDLSGWHITQCYFLELVHGLMGTFPAIDENNRVIATLYKPALERVWERLERRPAKVTALTVIAHPVRGIAFNLANDPRSETRPLRILSAPAIDALCDKKDGVHWSPGLLPMSEEPVRDPVFT